LLKVLIKPTVGISPTVICFKKIYIELIQYDSYRVGPGTKVPKRYVPPNEMLKTNAPKKHHLRKIPEQIILFSTLNAVIITIKFLGLSTLLNARSFILNSTFKVTRKTT
jgi:hypothetical protein